MLHKLAGEWKVGEPSSMLELLRIEIGRRVDVLFERAVQGTTKLLRTECLERGNADAWSLYNLQGSQYPFDKEDFARRRIFI